MDLYNTLGVGKDATEADIKKAYRKKAKSEHPDAGGSAERFNELQTAHRILLDPGKRNKYDRTGTVNDEPDLTQAKVLGLLAQLLDSIFQSPDAVHLDVLGSAKGSLRGLFSALDTREKSTNKEIKKVEKLIKKFKVKKGPNYIGQMLDTRLRDFKANLLSADQDREIYKKVEAILNDAEFTPEPRPAGQTDPVNHNFLDISDIINQLNRSQPQRPRGGK